ncbi:MAG: ABC transporter ATP-binding protein [Burkholderiaceae bacterium]|nr:ABC transporter ATP-binding protein [Burkholderiaceae bacterium]MCD8537698.1 ABC transporter ATP-binding protein [Burkholderiaceae bacterium]MCD8565517.1 ABC transporter ATP-binding protein [Burkholderiaceae bacterium]
MTKPVLTVSSLNAWYGRAQVLFGVDLTLNQGEVVAMMGRNGAGKTTFLKSLMGLVPKLSGQITLFDQPVSGMATHQLAKRGLGYVPQERRIFTGLTVRENLQMGIQPVHQWPDGRSGPRWDEPTIFTHLPNLAALMDRMGNQISGGEQQMLSLARTLMGNPLVLLLDEPSEGVAPIIVDRMLDMVMALKAQGVSILLSEQNLAFAQAVSDRVYLLEQGQIRFEGGMDALMADSATCERYLGVARV